MTRELDDKPASTGRTLRIPPAPDATFRLEASIDGDRARVGLSGNVGLDNVREVGVRLVTVREELAKAAVHLVTLDLRSLYFLSSAGLKLLVGWVTAIGAEPPERRYVIALQTDPNLHWQRRSLGALVSLEPDVVRIVDGEIR